MDIKLVRRVEVADVNDPATPHRPRYPLLPRLLPHPQDHPNERLRL